jgi:hypothetical protein
MVQSCLQIATVRRYKLFCLLKNIYIRAENGPKIFGPARRFAARPVPDQKISGTFPTMFARRFLLVYFFTIISVFRDIFTVLSMFL